MNLIPFAVYATAPKRVRERLGTTLWLTAVPAGTAAQQSAITAVAVTDEARRSLRREERIATAAVTATYDADVEKTSLAEQFARHPVLREFDAESIEATVVGSRSPTDAGTAVHVPRQAPPPAASPAESDGIDTVLVTAAKMVRAALGKSKGTRFTPEEAEEYREFLYHLRLAAADLADLLVAAEAGDKVS